MDIASDSPQGPGPNARSIIRASPFIPQLGKRSRIGWCFAGVDKDWRFF